MTKFKSENPTYVETELDFWNIDEEHFTRSELTKLVYLLAEKLQLRIIKEEAEGYDTTFTIKDKKI